MVHVFLLMVYLGTGDSRKLISQDMYFYDLVECNWYASQMAKRYGNYQYLDRMSAKDKVTSYCIPKYVQEDSVRIY
jgi:hypothetical protein